MSLNDAQVALLKTALRDNYVGHLPALLQPKNPVEDDTKNNSRALSALAISSLCDISSKDAAGSVVDDYGDFGIDAIYYHAPSDTLYLVQGKLKTGSLFSQEEANAFVQGVRKIIAQDFSGFNPHVLNRQVEIEDAVEKCSRIQLVVTHLGDAISHHAEVALQQLIEDPSHGEERFEPVVIQVDGKKIVAHLQEGQAYTRVDATLVLQAAGCRTDVRKTYIGFAAVDDLVKLHRVHGKALYAKNIRQHLGQNTEANGAIRQTLAAAPAQFEHLNNGVTILADRIEPKENRKSGKRLKLTGMSIINGAQTVASCASFLAGSPGTDISEAFVHVTIIQADGDHDFSKKVTKARNLQNPVVLQNFSALDDEQERLRRELALLGYHYVYKPEAMEGPFDPKRIRIDEAAQALAMCNTDPRYPVFLKKEPGQLLLVDGSYYATLFPTTLTAYHLLNAVIFARVLNGKVLGATSGTPAGYERLTYKHGSFVLGYILAKSLRAAWTNALVIDENKLDHQISIPFDNVRQHLWDGMQKLTAYRGPLSVLRNSSETVPLIDEVMVNYCGLVGDAAVIAQRARVNPADLYPQKGLFDYLAARAPQIGNIT